MEYPVEEIISYPLPALFVLAVFYGIYFAKMLAQKRRGIRTRQIGQRKEKSIHTVELLMSMATLGVVIAQLVSIALGWSCRWWWPGSLGCVLRRTGRKEKEAGKEKRL